MKKNSQYSLPGILPHLKQQDSATTLCPTPKCKVISLSAVAQMREAKRTYDLASEYLNCYRVFK